MSGAANALGQVGQSSGLTNLAQGISDYFTGGSQAPAPGQAANVPELAAQSALGGQQLFGMPTDLTAAGQPIGAGAASPNFLQGFVQGFTGHTPGAGADVPMGAGGELGGGLGQLFNTLESLRQGGVSGMAKQELAPIVQSFGRKLMGAETAPGYQQATAPQGGLVHGLINAFTYGLIDKSKMGGL